MASNDECTRDLISQLAMAWKVELVLLPIRASEGNSIEVLFGSLGIESEIADSVDGGAR